MKALSLWQPWATAIAVGLKRIETRSWATSYRGLLAIHAARRWTTDERAFTQRMRHRSDPPLPREIPRGAIVAIARLYDCLPTERVLPQIGEIEEAYGNYDDGRWAWMLADVAPLLKPVPFVGRQGLFGVPPGALVAQLPDSAQRLIDEVLHA